MTRAEQIPPGSPDLDIHDLSPAPGSRKKRKRIGRGISAGQGKTCGRGHKGDKARGQSKIGFEGGQTPLHRRLPRRRGFTNVFRREMAEVNVGQLELLDANTEVTPEVLLEKRIIRKVLAGVKVLGEGKLTKALTVHANAFSKGAVAKIEAAGGKAVLLGGGELPRSEAESAEAAPEAAEAPEADASADEGQAEA